MSTAVNSSNGAIKRWCHDMYNIPVSKSVPLETILELSKDPNKKSNGCRHIEFQVEENGAHPRSLEESIQNVNRELFGIAPNSKEIPLYDDTDSSKTDFALMLLTDPKYKDFAIPLYIKNGLVWLNDQDKMPEAAYPVRKFKMKRGASSQKV